MKVMSLALVICMGLAIVGQKANASANLLERGFGCGDLASDHVACEKERLLRQRYSRQGVYAAPVDHIEFKTFVRVKRNLESVKVLSIDEMECSLVMNKSSTEGRMIRRGSKFKVSDVFLDMFDKLTFKFQHSEIKEISCKKKFNYWWDDVSMTVFSELLKGYFEFYFMNPHDERDREIEGDF